MTRVLFLFHHCYPNLWRDGLWAALRLMNEDEEYEVEKYNIADENQQQLFEERFKAGQLDTADFLLGWGAFQSPVDRLVRVLKAKNSDLDWKIGLCIAGNAQAPHKIDDYDVLFYETEWYRPQIKRHSLAVHAFGTNTDIFNNWIDAPIIWDYLSVGAFAYWKRHKKMLDKDGNRLVIGEIQEDNSKESFDIIADLLRGGVGIMDMVYPTRLRNIYNCSGKVYIPADVNGGGERAVLEARACGRGVEVENDNPKLKELLNSQLYDQHYYVTQLKKGINNCF